MDRTTIQTYANLENRYWWFVGRRRVIEVMLEKYFSGRKLNILDWGCGPGGNFSMLQKFGRVRGVDSSYNSIALCHEKGFANVLRVSRTEELPREESYDLVTALDVIEHIDDDRAFLQELHKHLVPSGYVLFTVPAYQFLWSEIDDVLQHRRRYARSIITQLLRETDYQIIKASYFITFLAVPFILYRSFGKLMGRNKNPQFSYVEFPQIVNWFFIQLVYLEARLLRVINFPFGTSIIILARSKKGAKQVERRDFPNLYAAFY